MIFILGNLLHCSKLSLLIFILIFTEPPYPTLCATDVSPVASATATGEGCPLGDVHHQWQWRCSQLNSAAHEPRSRLASLTVQQTCRGSFSSVSTLLIARVGAFFSIFQNQIIYKIVTPLHPSDADFWVT